MIFYVFQTLAIISEESNTPSECLNFEVQSLSFFNQALNESFCLLLLLFFWQSLKLFFFQTLLFFYLFEFLLHHFFNVIHRFIFGLIFKIYESVINSWLLSLIWFRLFVIRVIFNVEMLIINFEKFSFFLCLSNVIQSLHQHILGAIYNHSLLIISLFLL